mmetsp:Transcript_46271/g.104489  ORF Transcript_46271/g.104489 Transcript_46271/m.104489 type:complete len:308 (-) Transcript_46271:34-957(-)
MPMPGFRLIQRYCAVLLLACAAVKFLLILESSASGRDERPAARGAWPSVAIVPWSGGEASFATYAPSAAARARRAREWGGHGESPASESLRAWLYQVVGIEATAKNPREVRAAVLSALRSIAGLAEVCEAAGSGYPWSHLNASALLRRARSLAPRFNDRPADLAYWHQDLAIESGPVEGARSKSCQLAEARVLKVITGGLLNAFTPEEVSRLRPGGGGSRGQGLSRRQADDLAAAVSLHTSIDMFPFPEEVSREVGPTGHGTTARDRASQPRYPGTVPGHVFDKRGLVYSYAPKRRGQYRQTGKRTI